MERRQKILAKEIRKETRKEKIEAAMSQIDEGIKEFFTSEGYKEYLKVMSKFYHYSVNNCILIERQFPNATHVAGYTDWQKKFKRHVKRGETVSVS